MRDNGDIIYITICHIKVQFMGFWYIHCVHFHHPGEIPVPVSSQPPSRPQPQPPTTLMDFLPCRFWPFLLRYLVICICCDLQAVSFAAHPLCCLPVPSTRESFTPAVTCCRSAQFAIWIFSFNPKFLGLWRFLSLDSKIQQSFMVSFFAFSAQKCLGSDNYLGFIFYF